MSLLSNIDNHGIIKQVIPIPALSPLDFLNIHSEICRCRIKNIGYEETDT